MCFLLKTTISFGYKLCNKCVAEINANFIARFYFQYTMGNLVLSLKGLI